MAKSEMWGNECEGLSTVEALNKLHNDIQQALNQFIVSQQARKSKSWVQDAFHHNSYHTTITWISVVYAACVILIQTVTYAQNFPNPIFVSWQPILILFFLTSSIGIELADNKFRRLEIAKRVENLLLTIRREAGKNSWLPENYPHLLLPYSPSITLQWTYRDNKLINLPWAVLVKDDIILIRPGQVSPGYCEAMEKSTEYQILHPQEVYGPSLQSANQCFTTPKLRKPLKYRKYKLLETPYLNNLKIFLDQASDRPTTIENVLRHYLMIKVIERVLFPIILGLILLAKFIKYCYFDGFKYAETWDMFVCGPTATIMPLLPVIFPVAWNCINYFGIARYQCFTNLLHSQNRKSFMEDEDDEILDNPKYKCKHRDVWNGFIRILKGEEVLLGRTTNLLHVLGSLTALCCVDKKGILSWPNPTAEKVFFLHNEVSVATTKARNEEETNVDVGNMQNGNEAVSEVLDITHRPNDPFQLHFDNAKWDKYLSSLKPLGLGVLLNTCNMRTQESYTKFCSHITCEAMYNENLIPVTNRRCLCELAKEIGFVEQAQKVFSLQHQLYTFRHLQNEIARRDSMFARSLHMTTKLKFPFPHMFAVVVKETFGETMQLLSQGTADLILDSCIDYWDGTNIHTLTDCDRKKVQDFYQRSSLTAYCTAFAYRPLHRGINNKLSKMYLELPRDCKQLYLNHRSPTPVHYENGNRCISDFVEDCLTVDPSLHNDGFDFEVTDVDACFEIQCNQIFIGMVTMQYQVQQDMVDLIEHLERGCIRFVHFSKENELRSRVFNEKMGLESGWNCHISLLSEKGRRESGPSECWANNGTIRVSSVANLPRRTGDSSTHKFHSHELRKSNVDIDSMVDSTKALSCSAPGVINSEHPIVKFDNECEPLRTYIHDEEEEKDNTTSYQEMVDLHSAQAVNTLHEWQSLSCLTNSTEKAPVNYDMRNRAMLPRGIENVRPHIENRDNVPLLVPLFTDCTPTNTKEMIKIMQEYGEVICVIGSSANKDNSGIFMQANASISVEPLFPQVCRKAEIYKPMIGNSVSPTELSRALNSIPCSLSVKREDPLTIYNLIIEARAFTSLLRNTMQFWICSCLSISFMQLLAAFLMLPSLLSMGQVLWICYFVIPLLSISLIGSPVDREFMKKPQGKKQIGVSYQRLIFVLRYYGLKFAPMVLITIVCFSGTLASYCTDMCITQNCTCLFLFYPEPQLHPNIFNNWNEHAQQFCVIVVVLHLITISVTFNHRRESLWQKSPHRNYIWLATVIILLVLQTGYSLSSFNQSSMQYENNTATHIGKAVVAFTFASPLLTLFICEMVKRQEIRENARYERRRKLDFDTKLGMNSPF